jgi:hypothetical protein
VIPRPALLALAAALLGIACSPSAPARPAAQPVPPIDISEIAAAVSAVRGLPQRAPVPVAVIDDKPFFDAMRVHIQHKRTLAARPAGGAGGGWAGPFDLLEQPGLGAWNDAVLDEQIVAFYDELARGVYVRRSRVRASDQERVRSTIAHEVQHALQHQNLPFPNLSAITNRDMRHAHKALFEGDAVLTQIALAATDDLESVPGAVVRAMVYVHSERAEEARWASGEFDALMRAPARIREPLVFPYRQGLTFVGQVWRVGGFPLLDRVFAAPPTTTEQVLHPEKYFAGEGAALVAPPPAPAGFRALRTGTLGELETSLVLAQCLPVSRARTAASGWGGDAFTVAEGPSGALALVWSTAWDDEAAAARFEAALRETAACGSGPARDGRLVAREGARVALVRGLAGEPAAAAARDAIASRVERPADRPPLGQLRPPPIPELVTAKPTFSGGWVHSARLGVWAGVPPSFAAQTQRGVELSVARAVPSIARGVLEVSATLPTPAGIEHLFRKLAVSLESAFQGRRMFEVSRGPASTPLGTGFERIWTLDGTFASMRVVVVPICGNSGSLTLFQAWVDPDGKAGLEAWVGSLRPSSSEPPPVCTELRAR